MVAMSVNHHQEITKRLATRFAASCRTIDTELSIIRPRWEYIDTIAEKLNQVLSFV